MVSSSFYHNHQSNLILLSDHFLPVNLVHETVYLDPEGTESASVYLVANGGNTKAAGFDLFTKYRVGRASLWGSVSYVKFEQQINETLKGILAPAPQDPININLGIRYRINDR
jgi:outer membrane receptor protein involved in Fe transport